MRSLKWIFVLLIGCLWVAACSEPSPAPTPPSEPSGQEQAHAAIEAAQSTAESAQEHAANWRQGLEEALKKVAAASTMAAEAAKLIAPDGTEILPCGEAPEGMVCIPGGPFLRGMDNDPHVNCKQPSYNKKGVANTNPAETIWLQTFYMDKTEVTHKAYQDCYKAGGCDKAGPRYIDFDRDEQAMTGMSWFDSRKFCAAQGKHLPTEAQWEKAARGTEGWLYPWGDDPEPSCEIAVIMNEDGERSCGTTKRGNHPEKGRVLEVCSRGEWGYGLCDMVGNAEEWVADWYSHSYEECGDDCQGLDPKGPCDGADECEGHRYRVVRGGSWYWPKEHATTIHRRSHVPSNDPYHHYGFRCAASLEEAAAMEAKKEE